MLADARSKKQGMTFATYITKNKKPFLWTVLCRVQRFRCRYLGGIHFLGILVILLLVTNCLLWLNIAELNEYSFRQLEFMTETSSEKLIKETSILWYLNYDTTRKSIQKVKSEVSLVPSSNGNSIKLSKSQQITLARSTWTRQTEKENVIYLWGKDQSPALLRSNPFISRPKGEISRHDVQNPIQSSILDVKSSSVKLGNVKLNGPEGKIMYFSPTMSDHDDQKTVRSPPAYVPFRLERDSNARRGINIERYVKPVAYDSSDIEVEPTCKRWVNKTAILFHARYPRNVWHFFNDGTMPLFHTLYGMGDLKLDTKVSPPGPFNCGIDRKADAGVRVINKQDVVLISSIPKAFTKSPPLVSWLYDELASERYVLEDVDGWCFKRLIVGASTELDYYKANSASKSWGNFQAGVDRFRRFVCQAAYDKLNQSVKHDVAPKEAPSPPNILPIPSPPLLVQDSVAANTTSPQSLPIVAVISRTRNRRILNEAALHTWIESRYVAKVQWIRFPRKKGPSDTGKGPHIDTLSLAQVIASFQRANVIIGMHGAGIANAFYANANQATPTALLQIFPYGWQNATKGYIYKTLAASLNLNYHEWKNNDRQHAYFQTDDAYSPNDSGHIANANTSLLIHDGTFRHPSPTESPENPLYPMGAWLKQDTFVDLPKFDRVLGPCLHKAGIQRR